MEKRKREKKGGDGREGQTEAGRENMGRVEEERRAGQTEEERERDWRGGEGRESG